MLSGIPCVRHKFDETTICVILTHWGWDKMAAVLQTTFSNACSWMKMYESWLEFHWSLFLRVQLMLFQHWFRQWLGAVQATSHYLKQRWLVYRRISVTRPQWIQMESELWVLKHSFVIRPCCGCCNKVAIYVWVLANTPAKLQSTQKNGGPGPLLFEICDLRP